MLGIYFKKYLHGTQIHQNLSEECDINITYWPKIEKNDIECHFLFDNITSICENIYSDERQRGYFP